MLRLLGRSSASSLAMRRLPILVLLLLVFAALSGGCYEKQSEEVQALRREVSRLKTESSLTEARLDEIESQVRQLKDETGLFGIGSPGGLKSRVQRLESEVSRLKLSMMFQH